MFPPPPPIFRGGWRGSYILLVACNCATDIIPKDSINNIVREDLLGVFVFFQEYRDSYIAPLMQGKGSQRPDDTFPEIPAEIYFHPTYSSNLIEAPIHPLWTSPLLQPFMDYLTLKELLGAVEVKMSLGRDDSVLVYSHEIIDRKFFPVFSW